MDQLIIMFVQYFLITLCELIERSYTIQHQMLNSKGFLAIGYHLEKVYYHKIENIFFLHYIFFRHLNNI